MSRAVLIACRTVLDAMIVGNATGKEVRANCHVCRQPILVGPFGQERQARETLAGNSVALLCNACALEVTQRIGHECRTEVETSPEAIESAEQSPAARRRMEELLRAAGV